MVEKAQAKVEKLRSTGQAEYATLTVDNLREAGETMLRALGEGVAAGGGVGGGGRDDLPTEALYAQALLEQALSEGPASGAASALRIPADSEKTLFFNHHRGRLPEIVAAGGVVVVSKTEAGRQRTAKALARHEAQLRGKAGVAGLPWRVDDGTQFGAAFALLRDGLVSEVQTAIEEIGLSLYMMRNRLHALKVGSPQRTAQKGVVDAQVKIIETLYDRLRGWRQASFLQLVPPGPEQFDGDWSKESVTQDLKTPWRADGVSLEERSESIDEIGCVPSCRRRRVLFSSNLTSAPTPISQASACPGRG